MDRRERERFDVLLERVIAGLPASLRELLDEVAVVVEDLPSPQVLREMGMEPEEAEELCGLHSGRAFTEGHGDGEVDLPAEIQLYRVGIIAEAGGWAAGDAAVQEEIRVTLLHEIGHQFGLDEDDLDKLGYG